MKFPVLCEVCLIKSTVPRSHQTTCQVLYNGHRGHYNSNPTGSTAVLRFHQPVPDLTEGCLSCPPLSHYPKISEKKAWTSKDPSPLYLLRGKGMVHTDRCLSEFLKKIRWRLYSLVKMLNLMLNFHFQYIRLQGKKSPVLQLKIIAHVWCRQYKNNQTLTFFSTIAFIHLKTFILS